MRGLSSFNYLVKELGYETVVNLSYFTERETACLNKCLKAYPGQVTLHVGPEDLSLLETEKDEAHYPISLPEMRLFEGVVAEADALPFLPTSVDRVVLHHVQEHILDSEALLSEAASVVHFGGYLIICGLNPMRACSASVHREMSLSYKKRVRKFSFPMQLSSRLAKLNFKVMQVKRFAMTKTGVKVHPKIEQFFFDYLTSMSIGYILVARKQFSTESPARMFWNKVKSVNSTKQVAPGLRIKHRREYNNHD